MSQERAPQVTFDNLVGAARFNKLEGAQLVRTRCHRPCCGRQDSWTHLQECYKIPRLNDLTRREKIEFFVKVRNQIQTNNPIRPETWGDGVGQEENEQ